MPLKLWGLYGYIINKKAAQKLVDLYPLSKQLDSEIPKIFPELNVKALKRKETIIYSPISEESVEFGSDIQFCREGFGNINDNKKILVLAVLILLLTIISYKYILTKCVF